MGEIMTSKIVLRTLAAFVAFNSLHFLYAAESDNIPWEKLRDSTSHYLEVCVSNQDRQSMSRKMEARIRQRVKDTGASAEQAAREIMFDWAADNSDKLTRHEPRALAQVCFYFNTFMDRGYAISTQIRDRLTPAICQEILEFLDAEVKEKSPH